MNPIGGLVDVVQRRAEPEVQAERSEAAPGLGGHDSGAPGHVAEDVRAIRPQAQQHVATIGHRYQHRVVPRQLRCGLANDPSRQRRAVRSHQQHRMAVRAGRHTVHGARHARTQVTVALVGALHAVRQFDTVPGRILRAGAHAQLHRANSRSHRLRQRVAQHAPRQPGGALGTQRRDQPRLGPSRQRCLGEDHDARRVRGMHGLLPHS
jgi:hypothetical protein